MNEHLLQQLDTNETTVPIPSAPVATTESKQECKAVLPETDEDIIEWDVKIETPPLRSAQTVTVRFVEGGKRPIRIGNLKDF